MLKTREPFESDCLRCFMFYAHNVNWYWLSLGWVTPPGGSRYQRVDQPLPYFNNVPKEWL